MFSTNTFFADCENFKVFDGNMFWRFDNFFVTGNKKKMAKFCWDKRRYVLISTSFCFYCLRTARATSGESKRSDSIRAGREPFIVELFGIFENLEQIPFTTGRRILKSGKIIFYFRYLAKDPQNCRNKFPQKFFLHGMHV